MPDVTITAPFVDWITARGTDTTHTRWLGRFLKYEVIEPVRTAYHRSHAVQYYPSEIRHYFSPRENDLDSIIVFDGSALNNIRREHDNLYCDKVCGIVARSSVTFTRFDVSVDIMDNGDLAWEVARLTAADKIDYGRRKAHAHIERKHSDGCSTYCGVRTSPKMMRLYDKSAETKGKIPATRIEFELKDDAAHLVCSTLSATKGYTMIPKIFNGLIRDIADWTPVPLLQSMIWGEAITIEPATRESQLSKKEWLIRQVAPTFTKTAGGAELWRWFRTFIEEGID